MPIRRLPPSCTDCWVCRLPWRSVSEVTESVVSLPVHACAFVCVFVFSDKESKLTVIHGDVLKSELPYFDVCVANVPYNVRHDVPSVSFAVVLLVLRALPPSLWWSWAFCPLHGCAHTEAFSVTAVCLCPSRFPRALCSSCWHIGPCSDVLLSCSKRSSRCDCLPSGLCCRVCVHAHAGCTHAWCWPLLGWVPFR